MHAGQQDDFRVTPTAYCRAGLVKKGSFGRPRKQLVCSRKARQKEQTAGIDTAIGQQERDATMGPGPQGAPDGVLPHGSRLQVPVCESNSCTNADAGVIHICMFLENNVFQKCMIPCRISRYAF